MLKSFLIGLTLAVLLDQAAFDGVYRDKVVGGGLGFVHWLVTQDWQLTHN
jgi:hypothetical protein